MQSIHAILYNLNVQFNFIIHHIFSTLCYVWLYKNYFTGRIYLFTSQLRSTLNSSWQYRFYHLRCTWLGAPKEGRTQHLLVTLSKPADASYLLSIARSLRTVSDPYVRSNVYFNKHFTPAEGRAAYESRVLRRTRSNNTATPHLHKDDGSSSSDSPSSSNVHPMPGTDTDRIASNIVDCMSVDPSDQSSTSANNILIGSGWQQSNHLKHSDRGLFNCALLNARSLNNKLPDFHHLLSSCSYKMIFVTETWFSNDVTDAMVTSNCPYDIIRQDRTSKLGGGVCALIDIKIPYSKLILTSDEELLLYQSCCDLIGLDVLLSDVKYRFILLYRPPHSSFKTGELQNATKSLPTLLCNLTHKLATTVFWVILTYQVLTGVITAPRTMIMCIITYLIVSPILALPNSSWNPPALILMVYLIFWTLFYAMILYQLILTAFLNQLVRLIITLSISLYLFHKHSKTILILLMMSFLTPVSHCPQFQCYPYLTGLQVTMML